MRIKEVIVVEGHHDTNVLQQYFDCETIETNGLALSAETLELIKEAQQRCGVIIFTDPDYPGEKIRRMINDAVDGCKNAYIEKNKAKTPKKVGVEHARREDLLEALEHCFTYTEQNEVTFTMDDIMEIIQNIIEGIMYKGLSPDEIAKKKEVRKQKAAEMNEE